MATKTKPLMPFVVALCAFGAGITGTLLWKGEQPSAPATTPATPTQSATAQDSSQPLTGSETSTGPDTSTGPEPSAGLPPSMDQSPMGQSAMDQHTPPPDLTRGLTPAQTALTLGNWYYDHEQWGQANDNYLRALKNGVDNPNIRTDLGNTFRFTNQPYAALKQYQRAQQQDPKHEESLFNQGALYAVSLKKPGQGVVIWKTYLQRFPSGQSATQARQLIAKFSGAE